MYGLRLLDIFVITAYFLLITVIGLLSTKKISTQKDFYVGGRHFGKFLSVMLNFGVGTSNTHPILIAGAVYTFGMSGIWYSWLYMLTMPIGWIIIPLIRRLRIYTSADFFELRYSKGLVHLFSFSAMLNICVMTGTILIGIGQITEGITNGGIDKNIATIIATAAIMVCATAGGMVAAALTDVIQGILIIVLSFMLLPPMFAEVGGLAGLHAAIPAEKFCLAMPQSDDPSKTIGIFAIFMLCTNGILSVLIEPQTMQVNQSVKDEWTGRLGSQIGSLAKRICTIGWALVGLCAIAIWPNLDDPELAFGMASRQFLPVGFSGLMIAAMFAAAMSTCSTMMVSGSAIFSRNIYSRLINKNATDKHYLYVARIVGISVVLAGLGVALWFGSVTNAVVFCWKITAFMGPTLVIGMFFRRGNSWGAWACMLASAVAWLLIELNILVSAEDLKWDTIWYQASVYLPAGTITYFIVSFLTKPEDSRKLDIFFARLNTPVGQEQLLIDAGLEISPDEIISSENSESSKGHFKK